MRSPFVAAIALLLSTSTAHAFDVFTCGLVVPAGQVGHLVGDLACPGSLEAGVYLEQGASLSLDGHSLLGDGDGRFGVACVGRCAVTGPGEVGFFESCITALASSGKMTVSDLDVHHCNRGITAAKLRAINVDAHHHAEWAFGIRYDMKGMGVTADDNGLHGFYGRKLVLQDSAMRRNGSHAVNVDLSFRGTNVVFEDNVGVGVIGDKINASGLTATGNGAGGVLAYPSLSLRDSTLVGNAGFDLGSERTPRLKNTTCDKSFKAPGAIGDANWGVCTQD